jgi:DNA-directed RNA polymerase subunit beta
MVVDLEATPIYLSAEEEEGDVDSQANIEMDNSGKMRKRNCSSEGDFPVIDPGGLCGCCSNQIASISASYSFLGT